MSSSMRRVERRRALLVGLARALSAVAGTGIAHAATPVPLAPCRIGALKVGPNMTLAGVRTALQRQYPGATFVEGVAIDGGLRRAVTVRDGADRLMTITYLARTPARLVNRIDLFSSRYQLAPGVMPGAALADQRAFGRVTAATNPELGVEDIGASALQSVLAGWEQAGCPVQLRAGSKPVGLYPRGAGSTNRLRPGARIDSIEIDL